MKEFSSTSPVRMKRRWRKAIYRLKHLPEGLDFFKYGFNKAYAFYLKK